MRIKLNVREAQKFTLIMNEEITSVFILKKYKNKYSINLKSNEIVRSKLELLNNGVNHASKFSFEELIARID